MKKKPTNAELTLQLERMTSILRQELIDGRYGVGDYLPSEAVLSKRFGLSNKSLRRGLDTLVDEGWIQKIARVGNRVNVQKARITLNIACSPTIERDLGLTGLLNAFQQEYPWIAVRPVLLGRMSDLFADCNESAADLFVINDFQFTELLEERRYAELEPLPPLARTFPFLHEPFTAGDKLYVRPLVFSPIVLCYNKAHFRERSLPEPTGKWTWSDLAYYAAQLSNVSGRFGFCFHLPSENRWPNFLLQSGEHLEGEGAQLHNLRGSKLLESIRICKDIIHNRSFFPLFLAENSSEINEMFQEGKLSMVLNSYTNLNDFRHCDLDYDISPIPFIDRPSALSFTIGAAVNRHSAHGEEAKLLVQYMASEEGQRHIHRHTTSIPSDQYVAGEAPQRSFNSPSRWPMFREMLFSYHWKHELRIPVKAYSGLFKMLKTYWAGMIDEDELCEQMVEALSK